MNGGGICAVEAAMVPSPGISRESAHVVSESGLLVLTADAPWRLCGNFASAIFESFALNCQN